MTCVLSVYQSVLNVGFTRHQSEALVRVLSSVAEYSSEQALSGHVSHKTLVSDLTYMNS